MLKSSISKRYPHAHIHRLHRHISVLFIHPYHCIVNEKEKKKVQKKSQLHPSSLSTRKQDTKNPHARTQSIICAVSCF